jgi:hypothetical protein
MLIQQVDPQLIGPPVTAGCAAAGGFIFVTGMERTFPRRGFSVGFGYWLCIFGLVIN